MLYPPKRVFICYRHRDSESAAGRFHDNLERIPHVKVFQDVGSVGPGNNIDNKIHNAISDCNYFFVVIGNNFGQVIDNKGKKRLFKDKDPVRSEIELAIELNKPVIPILVEGAKMPDGSDLPDNIAELAKIKGFQLRNDCWKRDFTYFANELGLKDVKSNSSKIIPPSSSILPFIGPESRGTIYSEKRSNPRTPEIQQQNGGDKAFYLDKRDGRNYKVIKVANKWWMAENFAFDADGTYFYMNNELKFRRWGKLYTWKAAREACPPGWRLPTVEDWDELLDSFYPDFTSNPGKKAENEFFKSLIKEGNSGFDSMFAGFRRHDGSFCKNGDWGLYWSSAERPGNKASSYLFNRGPNIIKPFETLKTNAYSCRYITDATPPTR